jgi:hypothetical protein
MEVLYYSNLTDNGRKHQKLSDLRQGFWKRIRQSWSQKKSRCCIEKEQDRWYHERKTEKTGKKRRSKKVAFLEKIVRDSLTYTEHSGRRTVQAMDVQHAMKRHGKSLLGFHDA